MSIHNQLHVKVTSKAGEQKVELTLPDTNMNIMRSLIKGNISLYEDFNIVTQEQYWDEFYPMQGSYDLSKMNVFMTEIRNLSDYQLIKYINLAIMLGQKTLDEHIGLIEHMDEITYQNHTKLCMLYEKNHNAKEVVELREKASEWAKDITIPVLQLETAKTMIIEFTDGIDHYKVPLPNIRFPHSFLDQMKLTNITCLIPELEEALRNASMNDLNTYANQMQKLSEEQLRELLVKQEQVQDVVQELKQV